MARSRRPLMGLPMLALALGAAGLAAWLAFVQVGRTPSEPIDYGKRRLQGHPRLEAASLPVLDSVESWLGEPDRIERALPFVVPPLPANPLPASVAGLPRESGDAMRILVGPSRTITSLGLAARLAPDGSVVEVDPGDYPADVAVWEQRTLTIRGTGPGVRLIASGRSAEGKAIWVIRRGRFVVENIAFIGARAEDRNAAGIRLEGGQLLVRRCTFHNNENGILTNADEDIRLEVEQSEFGYSGAGDGQSQGIYVGAIAHFRLTGSYFHHANVGHLVKSRARKSRIEYNRLSDETGGQTSYELEFPDGGEVEVVGNIVHQGSGTRNSVIESYGAEGYRWPVNRLDMAHNTLVNDRRYSGTFVRVSPGAQSVVVLNNLLVGPGRLNLPAAVDTVVGNRRVDWSAFVQVSREDYRLTATARAEMGVGDLAPLPTALRPQFEYAHPLRAEPLPPGLLIPGALQSALR